MPNATIVNFAAGETSQKSRGRFDTPWYAASLEKLLNWFPDVTGPARYREGFKKVTITRRGQAARLMTFVVDRTTQYVLEFTPGFMRAYKDNELTTLTRTTITAITNADPAVITVVSGTGLTAGKDIILSGIIGMPQLNGRMVRLGTPAGLNIPILNAITGDDIDSTGFGTYISGGTVDEVLEIATPYFADDLADINVAASEGTMYVAHLKYTPRKLTVGVGDVFTLATYVRTNDPLVSSEATLTVLQVTDQGSGSTLFRFLGVVTINPDVAYLLSTFGGVVEANGLEIRFVLFLSDPVITEYRIVDLGGNDIDSSSWSFPYTINSGTCTPQGDNPITVGFYEGRLCFAGTNERTNILLFSRAPDDAGVSRFDDFTGGTNADDAVSFALASASATGETEAIAWIQGAARYLFIGTFSGPRRVSGGGLDEPITPSSINVRAVDIFGCEATPAAGGTRIFFLQRGGTTLRTVRFNLNLDDYDSTDLGKNAEQIAFSRLQRCVFQVGRPDIVWVFRADGILAGMTFQADENVTGWHRHKIGGVLAKVIDVQTLPRTDRNDQLWIVASRTVDGNNQHTVERLTDPVDFPDKEDFFSDPDSEDANLALFENAVYRRQEGYIYLDGASTFNGSDRGVAAGTDGATLTPGAVDGDGVTFTSSEDVFEDADIGDEIWKKPDANTGIGSGRATIVSKSSATEVVCDITVDFDSTDAIPAGDWYFATKTIFGLWHLEGERVAVQNDGAVLSDGRTDEYPTITVVDAGVTLNKFVAVAHIGLPYEGFFKTQNLEMGGRSGPAQSKPRNIVEMFIKFLNTLGVSYGTDLYKLQKVEHRKGDAVLDRPAPVFSGIKKLQHTDDWEAEKEKHVIVSQRLPLPATVQFIDMEFQTADED